MIRMDKLIKIFADTQEFYMNDQILKEAVNSGFANTKLYEAGYYPKLAEIPQKLGLTLTLNLKSFQTAMKFNKVMPNKRIAVLNFASPIFIAIFFNIDTTLKFTVILNPENLN